jgi:2-oxoisovalerate dehydrogenase E1 component alpha subunit
MPLLRDLYTRMLLTRLVDECATKLYEQGLTDFVASCRGHEAAQVGSAICIEIGNDFTLPYYRDLGVVLTIGMTPREVFRTYIRATHASSTEQNTSTHHKLRDQPTLHWGYQKHNTVTGAAPVATHVLHAAGIAFASKLRKAPVVTVAYCGDGATAEPDFLEGIRFAALHQLSVVFICEQDCTIHRDQLQRVPTGQMYPAPMTTPSCLQGLPLPNGIMHQRIDGTDIVAVYTAMQAAMQRARDHHKPTILEMSVTRLDSNGALYRDPLTCCQQMLEEQGAWDQAWADQLYTQLSTEVEQAMHDALASSS